MENQNFDDMRINIKDRDFINDRKIKEVQQYFIDRIIDGNYEVIAFADGDCSKVVIKVINKYIFVLWIGDYAKYVSTMGYGFIKMTDYYSFMQLEFEDHEKKELHDRFINLWEKTYLEDRKQKLREQLDNLNKNYKI